MDHLTEPTRVPAAGALTLTRNAHQIIAALTAAGGRPYVVGGAVRDALLRPGLMPKDVDIEVFGLDIDDVIGALRTVGNVDEVGRAFSVLKLRKRGWDYDVSLPRRERKTGAGHRGFDAVADPHATLQDATARRDFTINALMYDPSTDEIVDCWGGLDDLRTGTLRHVSDAFAEDPLRVLRAISFAARFGFTLAPDTAALCRRLASEFSTLSVERVWTEWHKVATKGTHISAALAVLVDSAWDRHFPALAALRGVEQDGHWHPEGDVFTHVGLAGDQAAQLADAAGLKGEDRAVVVLAALLHDAGKVTHSQRTTQPDGTVKITSRGHAEAGVEPARAFLTGIGAPHRLIARVLPLVREHMATASTTSPSAAAVRRLARRLGPSTIAEWALVVEADKGGRGTGSRHGESAQWTALAAQLGVTTGAQPGLLRGEHLIAAGLKPGPVFGELLRAALRAQDDGKFADEAGALRWLSNKARLA